MTIQPLHSLFQSRTRYGEIAIGLSSIEGNSSAISGYLLGLEVAAAVCRSHIVSAAMKFGEKSVGVRVGRADLCCIEREIRRTKRSADEGAA
jgi:hypothetical protein